MTHRGRRNPKWRDECFRIRSRTWGRLYGDSPYRVPPGARFDAWRPDVRVGRGYLAYPGRFRRVGVLPARLRLYVGLQQPRWPDRPWGVSAPISSHAAEPLSAGCARGRFPAGLPARLHRINPCHCRLPDQGRPPPRCSSVVAVSTLLWNILVVYVDDAIVHLIFLWLILLPVGMTLNLQDWLGNRTATLDSWYAVTVPGASVRFFLANMALVYIVAAAYKFTSPMWRNGTVLHAILKLDIARAPEFWPLHRSVESRSTRSVWSRALAPNPATPRTTVPP
jgi:hypothetical protein